MDDLHAALTARIDEEERLHRTVLAQHPLPWQDAEDGLIWSAKDAPGDPVGGSSDPDVVRLIIAAAENGLRGLTEDRDILARHRRHVYGADTAVETVMCLGCRFGAPWPCPDWRSVARRHGLEVPGDGP